MYSYLVFDKCIYMVLIAIYTSITVLVTLCHSLKILPEMCCV